MKREFLKAIMFFALCLGVVSISVYGSGVVGCGGEGEEPTATECGDSTCDASESRTDCPQDCEVCGDDICGIGENENNCSLDCVICGDDICSTGETGTSCPEDCEECGDDYCAASENRTDCPEDCEVCGDDTCGIDETMANCPADCAGCGDGICSAEESPASCPKDCGTCGDGDCNHGAHGETVSNCKADCGCTSDLECQTRGEWLVCYLDEPPPTSTCDLVTGECVADCSTSLCLNLRPESCVWVLDQDFHSCVGMLCRFPAIGWDL